MVGVYTYFLGRLLQKDIPTNIKGYVNLKNEGIAYAHFPQRGGGGGGVVPIFSEYFGRKGGAVISTRHTETLISLLA